VVGEGLDEEQKSYREKLKTNKARLLGLDRSSAPQMTTRQDAPATGTGKYTPQQIELFKKMLQQGVPRDEARRRIGG